MAFSTAVPMVPVVPSVLSAVQYWPAMTRKQKVAKYLKKRRSQKRALVNSNMKRTRVVDQTKQKIANKRSRVGGRFKSSGTVWVTAQ